jgi:hypothetical protein
MYMSPTQTKRHTVRMKKVLRKRNMAAFDDRGAGPCPPGIRRGDGPPPEDPDGAVEDADADADEREADPEVSEDDAEVLP